MEPKLKKKILRLVRFCSGASNGSERLIVG